MRFEIPAVGLLVVREDASSVATRAQTARNPTDGDVSIPANGFTLAGTLTAPPGVAGRLRHPAVVLVGGAAAGRPRRGDRRRPGVRAAREGARRQPAILVLRYDRRGGGQSGGRTETATLADYADDVSAAVRWLSKRDDVDKRRIVVAGRGDGGAVALIAAARDKAIDGVVTLDAGRIAGCGSDPGAAAARARRPEAAAGRPPGAHRPAEEDPGGRHQRHRLAGRARRDAPAGGHAVVQERADLRSRRRSCPR